MSVPGLKGLVEMYLPGVEKEPKGNMYALPLFLSSPKSTELPYTLLG